MQITYTLTKHDYRQLFSRGMKQAFTSRPIVLLFVFLPGLMLSLSIGTLFTTSPFGHGDWNLIFLISGGIMIAWIGVLVGIFRYVGPQAYLKRPGAMGARVLALHPEGILADAQGIVTRIAWADVSNIAEERDYLEFSTGSVASLNRQIVFFVPLHAFASPADMQAFVAEAEALRASATAETAASWMISAYDPERDVSVSYSLTTGELGWMPLQAMHETFSKTYLTAPLFGVLLFGMMWVQSGNVVLAAVAACGGGVMSGMMMRRLSRRGPQTMGFFARSSGDYRITITPLGFEQRSPSGLNRYPWPTLTRITEQRGYVTFWAGRSPICMVAPSAFGSAEEAQAFLKTARDYHQCAQDGTPAPPPTRPTAWPPPPIR